MPKDYVVMVARSAYLWGWPLVNQINRRATFAKAPQAGRLGGVLPVAPTGYICMLTDYIAADERFVTCPNQDTVYGAGFMALDKQPVVVQVPDFGERSFYLSACRSPDRQLLFDWQAIRHQARLLSARRAELERHRASWDHRRRPVFNRSRRDLSARLSGRYAGRQSGDPEAC